MDSHDSRTYGRAVSRFYDRWYPEAEPEMLDVLQSLSEDGPVLELGIGSGRVALPLAERGIEIHGVDSSPDMVALMRKKSGGEDIPVKIGSFADRQYDGPFSMVFVVFNTFFALTTLEEQKRCFRSVAEMLTPGGRFVLECFFPDVARFQDGQTTRTVAVGDGLVRLECSRHDGARQTVRTTHVLLGGESKVEMIPLSIRYAWPSEMDLMAELAGLHLESRWGGWAKEPFDDRCARHVSVYILPNED